jgi:alkanesulfonate monooxygenase SsuD/methylene tetrahydromethanopterin reductase-like flavin-dependent oxidoreductase (luciferase family)
LHFGIEVVPFGAYSDPRRILKLAVVAENARWEAIWLWDHMLCPFGAGDPWIALAAVAASTNNLKLVTGVAPISRYRPHLLARMLAGLDILSDGRVIFGTGLGILSDFAPFGEPADYRTRAEMADEGLDLLSRLLSGERLSHLGKHYKSQEVRLVPCGFQQPRIPVWIGGSSRAALRRAAKWDGWIIGTINERQDIITTPERLAEQIAYIRQNRGVSGCFEVAVDGISRPDDSSLAQKYEESGATWWFESIFPLRGSEEEMLELVKAGPPG